MICPISDAGAGRQPSQVRSLYTLCSSSFSFFFFARILSLFTNPTCCVFFRLPHPPLPPPLPARAGLAESPCCGAMTKSLLAFSLFFFPSRLMRNGPDQVSLSSSSSIRLRSTSSFSSFFLSYRSTRSISGGPGIFSPPPFFPLFSCR